MFGTGIIEVVLLLVVVAGVVRLVLVAAARVGGGSSAGSTAGTSGHAGTAGTAGTAGLREARRVQAARLAGLVLGLGAAWLVAGAGRLGTGAMLAPAVLGLGVLLGVVAGETLARPPRPEGVRAASLVPRRVRDHLPRSLTAVVAVMLLLLVATGVLTTLTADADSSGTAGRALTCTVGGASSTRGPYPGSYYTVPLAAVLLLVLAVAVVAALAVVRRPRGTTALPGPGGTGGAGAASDPEAVLRRRSLGVIVAATGIAVCAPQVGVSTVAASALDGLGGPRGCTPAWAGPVGVVLGFVALAAVVVVVGCCVRLVAPRPGRA